ncbi:hypothetical protein GCM10027160_54700 [Streptomyces calidiresistens]|uniref:Uncharacterized protein n=1 Tax=Streptomyces calidiresistens TaxID=1485586 RepID=A0A7W3T7B4_9ACTN|nr:hypothetical protein [Streptomyces calidiresistens]MBB0232264.1 hypothetical protein [Streptomyces calidiresistens]
MTSKSNSPGLIATDVELRAAVTTRARRPADGLERSRIPRQDLTRALMQAFADPDDPRVYRALRQWM